MILEIKKIGKLESIQIHKTDKTNEYRNLNAQRESLEKTRAALISFKGKGGKIDELINIENKIKIIKIIKQIKPEFEKYFFNFFN